MFVCLFVVGSSPAAEIHSWATTCENWHKLERAFLRWNCQWQLWIRIKPWLINSKWFWMLPVVAAIVERLMICCCCCWFVGELIYSRCCRLLERAWVLVFCAESVREYEGERLCQPSPTVHRMVLHASAFDLDVARSTTTTTTACSIIATHDVSCYILQRFATAAVRN
jgi:hypothetical protein